MNRPLRIAGAFATAVIGITILVGVGLCGLVFGERVNSASYRAVRGVFGVTLPIRLVDNKDTWGQAARRFCMAVNMLGRITRVTFSKGSGSAWGWMHNARRLEAKHQRHEGFHRLVRNKKPVVSATIRAGLETNFARLAKVPHPFSQPGQSISYVHDFPPELLAELDQLYTLVLRVVNEALPSLLLHPIKQSFAERIYAIDYPGPDMKLPFHYDCNDASDFKCQLLVDKTDAAPSLSCFVDGAERRFSEASHNIGVFHPHSTFHGLRKGSGARRVLLFTYTQLVEDHRPIVCHADLVSRNKQANAAMTIAGNETKGIN